MKLRNSAIALAASTLIFASSAYAADGTITFTGDIVASTCKINGGTNDQTVALGKVSTTALKGAGTQAAGTLFTIALTGCGDTFTSAQVKFDATKNTVNSDLIALSGDSTATGVGIGVFESDGVTYVTPYVATKAQAIKDGAATFSYVAKYVATGDTVTAGTANSSATFTIIYN